MHFSLSLAFSALMVLASASTIDRNLPSVATRATKSSCESADEADCKEFCATLEQTSTCAAFENKITCYCSGGKKAPDTDCEARCLFCVPDQSTLEQVNRLLTGTSKMDEL